MCEDSGMDWTDVVGAVCAVLSMCGAGFAWWRANLSRRAKEDAEAATARAEQEAKAAEETALQMRRTAEHLEQLVSTLAGPRFTLRPTGSDTHSPLWRLTSNRGEPQTITDVTNRDEFVRLDFATPVRVEAHQVVELLALGAWGKPRPASIGLTVDGVPDTVWVPFG